MVLGYIFFTILFALCFISLFSMLTILPLLILIYFTYCYVIYNFIYKGKRPRYPLRPPLGTDIYFPRTSIPRPLHEDVRRYPWLFKVEKKYARRSKRKRC